jgi:hypothetical protein
MKFVISLLFTTSAFAAPINVYFENEANYALKIKEMLHADYMIPDELMVMRRIGRCETAPVMGQLDLCLKNNGDLQVVSVDRSFVSESLKIFRAP